MSQQFQSAVRFVTPSLRKNLLRLPQDVQAQVLEVRLRTGGAVMLTTLSGTVYLLPDGRISGLWRSDVQICSDGQMQETFLCMCGYSVHSVQREICEGFLTLPGGHRVGLCGRAVTDGQGKVQSLSTVTSINLRIARPVPGAAKALMEKLFHGGLCSVLIAGPPLSGKTTVLRDLARRLSEDLYRVSVVDSRRELESLPGCDVLSGYGKKEGIVCALRSLSPEILLCDEVTDMEEIQALEQGFATGVASVVTVHAREEKDLLRRPVIRRLLETEQFSYVVLLDGENPCQIRKIYKTEDLQCADG